MNYKVIKYPMDSAIEKSHPTKAVVFGNIIFMNSFDARPRIHSEIVSNDFAEQLFCCLEKIRLELEELGCSMSNLCKLMVLLKDVKAAPLMWKGMLDYYNKYAPKLVESPPVVTVTQVEALATSSALIEMDALAVLSEDEPGWEMKKQPLVSADGKRIFSDIRPGEPFYSESVTIGNLVLLSAMGGENPRNGRMDENTFEGQWEISLDKINAALDRVGGSMSNIIKTLHFQCLKKPVTAHSQVVARSHGTESDRLWKAELSYFEMHAPYLLDEFPGSTFLKVSQLAHPESLGQNEVVAVLDRYRPGWEVRKYPTYIGRRGFPRHIGEIKKYYSNVVRVGSLLFVSGQTATNNYSGIIETSVFEEQLMVVLNNLKASLEEAGSSLENIIKTYVLLPDPDNAAALRSIEKDFYKKYAPRLSKALPVSTMIHPFNLASPSMLVEIEVVAFTNSD